MNYNWTNNTLTYDLPSNAKGVKIKYKKDGEENWIVVFESMVTAPSSLTALFYCSANSLNLSK